MEKQMKSEMVFAYHRPTKSRQYSQMKCEENKDIFLLLNEFGGQIPNLPKLEVEDEKGEFTQKSIRQLANNLCEKYPQISVYEGVFGGQPHLKETRFRVSDVLSAFCIYDSVEEVIDNLENRYSKEQLKSALRFARDFLDNSYTLPEFE